MAAETAYDLRFRLFNIPVRVHPMFWLIMVMLSHRDDIRGILIFTAVAFISIVVHEFGHGLSARALGYWPSEIVLYGMGGYCQCEIERQRPWQKLIVLFCGPGAGFLLAAAAWGFLRASYRMPFPPLAFELCYHLVVINIAWGLLNLLPIWPLDGGQITEVGLKAANRRNGTRWTHVVSLLAAGGLGIWQLERGDIWLAVLCFYFGFINYQRLQALHQMERFGDQDDDWWRRS